MDMDMPAAAGRDPIKMTAERAAKFIVRGLLILLAVYLFSSMKTYAINYTGGDTWFTTFAVIVVAVPIAEIFCILGQTLIEPMVPVGSLTRSGDSLLLDAEEGSVDYTTAPLQMDANSKLAAMLGMSDAYKEALDKETARIIRCIIRALLALLWVYLVDLSRRFMSTLNAGEIIFIIPPFGILAASVSALFFFLMESFCESFH